MGLSVGTKLGPYELQSLIGAGGMGEVYRARDTRLNRTVAVKVLPSHLAESAEARERFEREARAISALNHPFICHLYDVGEEDGHSYLVMEHLEGETLSLRLLRGRLALDLTLRYAIEIADALDAAHRRGIVHRDLKPGNTFLTQHGECKVLDFGLAKIEQSECGSDAPTVTVPELLTTPGSAVGTAAYMSPEQVRGDELDSRTDIFSFGTMLYEMLTGNLPFRGKTSGVIAECILNRHPEPATSVNPEIPPEMERVVNKALEKDRDLRYQSAAELRADLKRLQRDSRRRHPVTESESESLPRMAVPNSSHATVSTGSAPVSASIKTGRLKWLVAAAALLMAFLVAGWWFASRRHVFVAGEKSFIRLTEEDQQVDSTSISADGKYVAFAAVNGGKHSLWLRQSSASGAVKLTPDQAGAIGATTFSPDGDFIYFNSSGKDDPQGAIYAVPTLGASPKRIVSDVVGTVGFSPDGRQIAFVRENAREQKHYLLVASADGTGEKTLAQTDAGKTLFEGSPSWSPDGKRIAVAATSLSATDVYSSLLLVDMNGNTSTVGPHLGPAGRLCWLADGSGLVYTATPGQTGRWQILHISYPDGAVSRITNDLDSYGAVSLGVSRDGTTLVTLREVLSYQVFTSQNGYGNVEQITHSGIDGEYGLAANGGKLVYATENIDGRTIWVSDYDGSHRIAVAQKGRFPRISVDGKLIAFPAETPGKDGIWLVGSDGGGLRQLTTAPRDYLQVFSPDGKWIYYSHLEEPIFFRTYRIPTTGGTPARVSDIRQKLWDISPDGQTLIVEYWDDANQWHWGLVSTSDGKLLHALDLPRDAGYPAYMPSGDAIAYVDTRDGVSNVWKWPLKHGKPVQLTHFNSDEIISIAFAADGTLFLSRGRTTSEALLIKNFQARN